MAQDHSFFGQYMHCRSSADCAGSLCVGGKCVSDALNDRSTATHDNCTNTAETKEEKARCKRDRENDVEFTCTSDLAFRKEKGTKSFYGKKEYLELDGNCQKKYEYCKKHKKWGLEEAKNSQGYAQGSRISSDVRCRRKMEECVKTQGSNAHKGVISKGQLCRNFQNPSQRDAARQNFIKTVKFDVGPRDGVDYQVCDDKSLGHKFDVACPMCLESRDCQPNETCTRGECRRSATSCATPDPQEVSMKSVYCTEMDRPTFVQSMKTNREYRKNCSDEQLETKYDRLCQDYVKCSEAETVGAEDSVLFPTVEQKYDVCNLGKSGDQFGHFKKVVKDQPQFKGCTDDAALRNKYDASCTSLTVPEIGRLAVMNPGKASRAGAVVASDTLRSVRATMAKKDVGKARKRKREPCEDMEPDKTRVEPS